MKNILMSDPYSLLGVKSDCSDEELRQAYFEAVRRHPPDRDREGFARVRAAYEAVQTPELRMEWRLGFRKRSRLTPREILECLDRERRPVGPGPWLAMIAAARIDPQNPDGKE